LVSESEYIELLLHFLLGQAFFEVLLVLLLEAVLALLVRIVEHFLNLSIKGDGALVRLVLLNHFVLQLI
jgi:hypothetical protein